MLCIARFCSAWCCGVLELAETPFWFALICHVTSFAYTCIFSCGLHCYALHSFAVASSSLCILVILVFFFCTTLHCFALHGLALLSIACLLLAIVILVCVSPIGLTNKLNQSRTCLKCILASPSKPEVESYAGYVHMVHREIPSQSSQRQADLSWV